MKREIDYKIEESIKHLREWATEENYSVESTEKLIESLKLIMKDMNI